MNPLLLQLTCVQVLMRDAMMVGWSVIAARTIGYRHVLRYRALTTGFQCEHVLAARLSEALGTVNETVVPDSVFVDHVQ